MERGMRHAISTCAVLCLLAGFAQTAHGAVYYVKTTGLDTSNGLSWAAAKKTVQAAITAAPSGSEVWVAAGTYVQCIKLKSGVSVYGGFGGTESARNQRLPATYVTVLDGGSIDSVVTAPLGATSGTVIDGFTIQNGRGTCGGGVSAYNSAITVSNNIVRNNRALYYGGGIYGELSTLTIKGNTIRNNRAPFGAGISCYNSASPVIIGNTIASNNADYDGSGVYCYSNSAPVISSNLITSNSAASEGAGLYCDDASPVIVNNTISGNSAASNGGGLACRNASPVIANNIIVFGSSGIRSVGAGVPSLVNNCLFTNSGYQYSGLAAGKGDVLLDPQFVNSAGGDYRLSAGSPLINSGDNNVAGLGTTDIAGAPRIQGGAVDPGAFEAAYTKPAITNPMAAKSAASNSWVLIDSGAVSAAFPGAFYVEADNRASGIRVEKPGHSVLQSQRATVEGVVRTNADGERYIHALSASGGGSSVVKPLYINGPSIGGVRLGLQEGISGTGIRGLNNIGLLVKTTGKFTYVSPNTFTIDNGLGGQVKCVTTGPVTLDASWRAVAVTGISSCERAGGELRPVIRVRSQTDIQPY